jgi:hypothetical protein
MAAGPSIDVSGWLEEQLAQASPDLLRAMVQTFAEALMDAEPDAVCGAAYGERSSERANIRNGYRRREWDTRAGSRVILVLLFGAPIRQRGTSCRFPAAARGARSKCGT